MARRAAHSAARLDVDEVTRGSVDVLAIHEVTWSPPAVDNGPEAFRIPAARECCTWPRSAGDVRTPLLSFAV